MILPLVAVLFSIAELPANIVNAYDDRMNNSDTKAFQTVTSIAVTFIALVAGVYFMDYSSNLGDIHRMRSLYEQRKQLDPISQSVEYHKIDDEMIELVKRNQNCAYLYDMNATLHRR